MITRTVFRVGAGGTPGVTAKTWTVGAFFLPGPVSTPAASFTKGSVYILEPKQPRS